MLRSVLSSSRFLALGAGILAGCLGVSLSTAQALTPPLPGSAQSALQADTLEALASSSMKAVVRLDVDTESGSRTPVREICPGSGVRPGPDIRGRTRVSGFIVRP